MAAYEVDGSRDRAGLKLMVEAFRRASGHPIPLTIAPRREGDIAKMQANSDRAAAELGWRAALTLDDMAASTWAWQSGNPDGYGD